MLSKLTSSTAAVLSVVVVITVIVCATVLAATGHAVPSWFEATAVAALGAGLGHALITGSSTSSSSPPKTTGTSAAPPLS